ncbi:hypothetical protein IFM89_000315 [Coptis chinensis]|uniref:ubiquitinyl hydrolase 1 n=1 Tax=Coptis chinensis TaxID=261450 RepID=A0A835HBV7_9MAGN|nr:hypothetical protein IFM89_000315 [Coptis chinensis]
MVFVVELSSIVTIRVTQGEGLRSLVFIIIRSDMSVSGSIHSGGGSGDVQKEMAGFEDAHWWRGFSGGSPFPAALLSQNDMNLSRPFKRVREEEEEETEHLWVRLKKEQEEKEHKKKEAQLCTIIKVARNEDLVEQIGRDFYFDLVDYDKVHSFCVQKHISFIVFKEEVAEKFGIPVQFQRLWLWVKRKTHTYRPYRPLTPQEEIQSVGQLRQVSNKAQNAEVKLFLEVELGPDSSVFPPFLIVSMALQDLRPIKFPEKTKKDILLFLKLYDPIEEELRYVGRLFVKRSGRPSEILSKLNEMAGFSSSLKIKLYEEIKFVPYVTCRPINKKRTFRTSQKFPTIRSGLECRYPVVPSFLEYVHNRRASDILYYEVSGIPLPELRVFKTLKVAFHHPTKHEVILRIRLPKESTVGDLLNDLKRKIKLSHPNAELRLLVIFYHKIYKVGNLYFGYYVSVFGIPEEEKNLGAHDRLIHVYHFTKDISQNQMLVQDFGEPFFLVIYEGETLAEVKLELIILASGSSFFCHWVALSTSRTQILCLFVFREERCGAWEQYRGLEHCDSTQSWASVSNQVMDRSLPLNTNASLIPETASTTNTEDLELAMAINASIHSAMEERTPLPNAHMSSVISHTNDCINSLDTNSSQSDSGPLRRAAAPLIGISSRLSYQPAQDTYNGGDMREAGTSDSATQSGPSSCVICLDAPLEGACVPCGHMAGCMSCLNEIRAKKWGCPVCRAKVKQVLRIYAVKCFQSFEFITFCYCSFNKAPANTSLLASKFSWTIDNFSKLNTKKLYSDIFVINGYKWRLLMFPKGNHVNFLSVYLDVADSTSLSQGWSISADYGLSVVNQRNRWYTVRKDTKHQFNARESDWGFTSFISLGELRDPGKGFLLNDTLIVEAEVSFSEGKLFLIRIEL